MDKDAKDRAFRIGGIFGLAVLLVLVLWARQPRAPHHDHDHARPARDERAAGEIPGKELEPVPSGRVENGVRVVEYDAYQYGFDPDPLVVFAGERVRLLVRSRDVEHGVMIPEVNFQTEMPVGEERKEAGFSAPGEPGEYQVFCSVYCGPGHGQMTGSLVVLPRE